MTADPTAASECALWAGDLVTNTATGETATVSRSDGMTVHVDGPDGAAQWPHDTVIWADGFNPGAQATEPEPG